ncbi:Sphingoid long-chain base transporter RSB1 [Candida viswanathii]|uniref:Sphingoid long-chain base transporter RSB1 n=1 Tax=Candida viswanathii TaxID=5486 RepID=A0A367Y4A9_9ASCO|nr:Sphingoid long-chain base transporter RSB1 [Candida viswanathii]
MDATTLLNQYLPTWTPASIPTTTTYLSTIDPTATAGLALTLLELQNEILTQTNTISLYFLSKKARGAAASITLLNDQRFLATATATQDFPRITAEMVNATLNLRSLEWSNNLYAMNLSVPFNALFTVLFGLCLVAYIALGWYTRVRYFTVCLVCGTVLEMIGYLARTLAHYSWSDPNLFLCQIITLTVAPAFIMAGIYYLLAQLIVVTGDTYSVLRPRWFCYIFIVCDVVSLLVQAAGGAAAAISLRMFKNTKAGTYVMVGGIAFQVVSMTFFLILLFDFIHRSYFKAHPALRFSPGSFLGLLFNTKSSRTLRAEYLEPSYAPRYAHMRARRWFNYMPLVILVSVVFIYVRCIYRVIELAEGWRGYLITHEEYIFVLDALMALLTCVIYVVYHPGLVFGRGATRDISTKHTPRMSLCSHDDEKQDREKEVVDDDDDDDASSFDPKDWDINTLPRRESRGQMPVRDTLKLESSPPSSRDWNARELTPNTVPISQKYSNPYLQPTRFSQTSATASVSPDRGPGAGAGYHENHRVNNSMSTSNTYTTTTNHQVDNDSDFEFNYR